MIMIDDFDKKKGEGKDGNSHSISGRVSNSTALATVVNKEIARMLTEIIVKR